MAYDRIAKQLLSRMPATAPSNLTTHVETALSVATKFQETLKKIKEDGRLSDAGRREAILDAYTKGPSGHLSQLKDIAKKGLDGVQGERAALATRRPDKSDLFAEMQRQEVRTWLRSLPEGERMSVALSSKDPSVRDAILMAPAAMSGLQADVRDHVLTAVLEEAHGPRLRALDETQQAYELLDAAVKTAENFARADAGMDLQ